MYSSHGSWCSYDEQRIGKTLILVVVTGSYLVSLPSKTKIYSQLGVDVLSLAWSRRVYDRNFRERGNSTVGQSAKK